MEKYGTLPLTVSGLTKTSVILLCIFKSVLSQQIKRDPVKPLTQDEMLMTLKMSKRHPAAASLP